SVWTRSGAATAATTSAPRMQAPAATARRPLGRSPGRIAQPGIDRERQQIDDRVDGEVARAEREHAALHQRIVTGVDCLHDQPAEPGPGEDRFGDDRAGEEAARL